MDKVANPVGWFEIYVSDMTRAKTFYTAVFGRELTSLPAIGDGGEMYRTTNANLAFNRAYDRDRLSVERYRVRRVLE